MPFYTGDRVFQILYTFVPFSTILVNLFALLTISMRSALILF